MAQDSSFHERLVHRLKRVDIEIEDVIALFPEDSAARYDEDFFEDYAMALIVGGFIRQIRGNDTLQDRLNRIEEELETIKGLLTG